MLSEETQELLSAFVDGELNAPERVAVARLLQQSSEARELVRHLQENAHRLRQLPRRRLEPGFADDVLQMIAMRHPRHARPRGAARRRWLPAFAASAAAVLLVAVFGGLY
jgi:anti-sigma factor RsiW